MNNQNAQKGEHGMLETTAQAIGSTLGSIAVKTGIAKPPAAVEHPEPQAAQPHAVRKPAQYSGVKHPRRSKKKK